MILPWNIQPSSFFPFVFYNGGKGKRCYRRPNQSWLSILSLYSAMSKWVIFLRWGRKERKKKEMSRYDFKRRMNEFILIQNIRCSKFTFASHVFLWNGKTPHRVLAFSNQRIGRDANMVRIEDLNVRKNRFSCCLKNKEKEIFKTFLTFKNTITYPRNVLQQRRCYILRYR